MAIHGSAQRGFSAGAASYERGRPTYPEEAVAWLAGRLGLGPGRTVVDVGAGTGKLTRMLVPTGARVIAVEPVAAMSELLHRLLPAVELVLGTADATGLAAASADAITAGQSFHWFSTPAGLSEFHRVLRPGGGLGLIWNERRRDDPTWLAVEALIGGLRGGEEPDHSRQEWRPVVERSDLFSALEEAGFDHSQELSSDQFVDRVTSISYVALLPPDQKAELAMRLRQLAERRPAEGPLRLAYRTAAFVCHALP